MSEPSEIEQVELARARATHTYDQQRAEARALISAIKAHQQTCKLVPLCSGNEVMVAVHKLTHSEQRTMLITLLMAHANGDKL